MQHDFQDIHEVQQSSSESLKLTQNTGGQLICLRPKAVEVASVIAAETLPPTFHAADLKSFRAYLEVQRPGSNWLRFSSD